MANMNYKVNFSNRDGYKYGNTFNGTLDVFFQTKVKKFTFMPMLGSNVEQAAYDGSDIKYNNTGGYAVFANIGIQTFWKDFQLFGEFQKAVSNKMNGYNQLINKYKVNIGLIYNF